MKDKVLSWMREQRMTAPGDTVICAVSGGADSVCMLHVLLSLRTALGITVEAVHFNHHLRGAESDRDESFVRALCAKLDVALHIGNGDVRARAAKRFATRSSLPFPALLQRHTRRTTIWKLCS